jgi:uncharacterized membrane protein
MTKKQYLQQLKQYLGALSPSEVEDIITEINERFTLAAERQETVTQVIAKLGTPEFLAQSYLKTEEQELPTPKSWNEKNTLRLVLVLIVNFLFIFWLWFSLLSVWFAGFITTLSLMGAGVLVILLPLFAWLFPAYTQVIPVPAALYWSGGATLFFASLFGFLLLLVLGRWGLYWSWRYLKFCWQWIKKD